MKRQLILSTLVASTLLFSSASAFSLLTTTCNYFGVGCSSANANLPQDSQVYSQPQAFSFTDFFNKWQLPPIFTSGNPGADNPTQVAQLGNYSPSTIDTGVNNNQTNIPNTTDFGIKDTSNSATTPQNLLSLDQILSKQSNFNEVLKKCSDGSTSCIAQVTQSQKTPDLTKDLSNTNNQTTPGSEYLGPRTSDNLTGTQSPNYDSGEENHINSGPLVRGPEDSQISQQAKNFNGSQYFVNRGTGSCANYGIDVGGSCPDREGYQSDFKATMSNLCSNLTGKRLQITSGNRSAACNARVGGASGSSHMSGLAMDTRLDNYSRGEKVIIVMYLAAQGFNNFGGYGPNSAMHFDMRNSINRWGPNYSISSCESRLFPDYFREAMSIMGSDPCGRDSQLKQKAINALNKMGKSEFARPANNKAVQ